MIYIEKKIKSEDILRGNLTKEKYLELSGADVNVVGLSTYFILSAFCICLTKLKPVSLSVINEHIILELS